MYSVRLRGKDPRRDLLVDCQPGSHRVMRAHVKTATQRAGVLETHISNRHPPAEGFTCEECGLILRNQASLQRHLRTEHRPPEQHQCSQCGATYASKSALRKHEVYHTKKWKWHRCQVQGCKKKCKAPHELRVHEKTRHSKAEDRIECPQCGELFKNLYSLNGHIASKHPRAEGYTCSLCDHVARSRPRLREHVLGAHNERGPHPPSRGRPRKRGCSITHILSGRRADDWGERVSVNID